MDSPAARLEEDLEELDVFLLALDGEGVGVLPGLGVPLPLCTTPPIRFILSRFAKRLGADCC